MTEQANIIIHQLSKEQLILLVGKLYNESLLSDDEIKTCNACDDYCREKSLSIYK